ncbi:hypothetical protein [Ulvibacter antarcticus]|uniref:Uncharacterized protein n=1 Tax=Ulvibacter antarcticus TaxID=442714 RepID=A0A3L9YUS5_9FLAO|nr:hypothetical protein [Ulvibacter antarcticus]RMA64416.1 hypothetical protein BXY75_1291 [Ulvibacter antarcticus]
MKIHYSYKLFSFLSILLWSFTHSFAQVGINTTTPRTTLEVGGDLRVSESLEIGTLNPLVDADTSTFLIQNNSNYIKSLDVSNPTGAALGYIQEYVITNPELDWVRDFNTGIDSKDYVLIVLSASYDLELKISTSSNAVDNSSLPYTATFIQGNKWHIIADYPMVANKDTSAIGTWTITTLIFSKDLSKQLGSLNIPMLNASTGSALSPIID